MTRLDNGSRLGLYEIVAPLGAGGMGQVFRARDTKLGRDVALKILPDSFTHDPERLGRFRREAQVLASLNHPHIGAIYGLDEANGTQFLVLELVDGESLDKRIARGPIPVDEALAIAKQIAEALEAAHEKGIIHRDLKPANIALTKDGSVKVLDFGLAKVTEAATGSSLDVTNSPTITSPVKMTSVGMILGTAAYMSPEQAKGRAADKRSDIWAFGCVLYEMLTSTRAFDGADVSDMLASVLKSEPDWDALPADLSPSIRALLQGCLKKDRKQRIGDMSTALFLLNEPQLAMPAPTTVAPPLAPRRLSWKMRAAVALAGLVVVVAGGAIAWRLKPEAPRRVARFTLTLPPGQQLGNGTRQTVAISPDGTLVVYVANGALHLWALTEVEPRMIPAPAGHGTASLPTFSPDGHWLAFWSQDDHAIKRIPVTGGAASTICSATFAPFGISWDEDDILFGTPNGVMRVAASGGTPELLIDIKSTGGSFALDPTMLPDRRTVLFTIAEGLSAARRDKARIVAQSLATGERKVLIDGGSEARYVATHHLVYLLGTTLFAVPFDLSRLAVSGHPVPVLEGVRRNPNVGGAAFAFSNAGWMVYVPGAAAIGQDLALFDSNGNAVPLKLPPAAYSHPRVSLDSKRLVVERSDDKATSLWVYELSGGSSIRRLTFGGNDRYPIWTNDSHRVVFQSDREGDRAVFWQPADGGPAERLTRPEQGTEHVPEAWSPSGDALLYDVVKGPAVSLWMFSARDRKSSPFDNVSSTVPSDASFSPDGRWVAYQSNDSGLEHTYVQSFPPTDTKYQIAPGGRALWTKDGKQILIDPGPGEITTVRVNTRPNFSFTVIGTTTRRYGSSSPTLPRLFDSLAGGRIIGIPNDDPSQGAAAAAPRIRLVMNWFEELKAHVPAK